MRILLGECIIYIDNDFHRVYLYIEGNKLVKDAAYIFPNADIVYIYRGKCKKNAIPSIPGVYRKDDGLIFVDPDESNIADYSVDNIRDMDTGSILSYIADNADEFVQPDDIEIINSSGDIYIPTIGDDDDFLKRIIKEAIIAKRINLKNYKDKFSDNYSLTNMKSGLSRSTKMTVPNFLKWCEILGLDWKVILSDSGADKYNPLPKEISIDSIDGIISDYKNEMEESDDEYAFDDKPDEE